MSNMFPSSPRGTSDLPLLDDQETPINSLADLKPPPSRAKYLWTRVRNVSRILGRLNKMLSDIQTFGASRKEYPRESLRDSALAVPSLESKWVLRPESCVRKYWSLWMILLLMYTAVVTPYRVCFVDEATGPWLGIDIATDVLFVLDICLTFCSAYEENDGSLVTNPGKIAKNYLKSWFLLDVLGCLPINYIFISSESSSSAGDTYNRLLRLLRLPRMYRLLRVFRLMKMMRVFRSNSFIQRMLNTLKLNSGILRLMRFGATIVILVHVSGCFWYLLAKLEDFGPDTWVTRYEYSGLSNSELYIMSIYYVFTTLTTVGFGDIAANTINERIFAVILMGFGVGFYSYTISNLSTIMENIDIRSLNLKSRLSTLNDFCKDSKLPKELKAKIYRHIVYNHEENIYSWLSQDSLLKELPAALQAEISEYMHRDIVQKVPFLQDKDPGFVSFIVPDMKNVAFKAGEVVFQYGEHADEVYFILEGRVACQTSQGAVFRTYIQGNYFGEVDILENLSRGYTAQVTSKTAELLIMTKANLWKMMEEFPQIALEMIETAREKEQRNVEALKSLIGVFNSDSPEATIQGKSENCQTDGIIAQRRYKRRRSINGTMDFDPLEQRHTGFTVKILRSPDRNDEKQAYWDKLKEKYTQPEPLLNLNTPSGSDNTPATPHTRGNADFTAQAMPFISPQRPNSSPKSHLDEMASLWKERKEAVEEQFAGTRKVMEMIAKRQAELRNMMQAITEKRGEVS